MHLNFCLDFWSCKKNILSIWLEIRLTLKIMTPQPGHNLVNKQLLPNISQSKDNQTMKFGQLIENSRYFFSKSYAENEARRLVPHFFLFFKKTLYERFEV